MNLTIRERCGKVAECLKKKGVATIKSIALATGLSKSSVHRHKKALSARNQHSESAFWETQAGSEWLKLMVLGVVYYFGVKEGIGCERLSEFLESVRLGEHVGISPSAIRGLKTQIKQGIIRYSEAQAEKCQQKELTGICVGGDETFFDLPVLVMMELATGFIFTEAKCENRSYQTWYEQIQQWWTHKGWQCHFMVSDSAPGLIKLALSGLNCASVPDLFHALRGLARPIGSGIGRQIARLHKKLTTLQASMVTTTVEDKRQILQQSIDIINQELQVVELAQQKYNQALHAITLAVHPFDIDTHQWQLSSTLSSSLNVPLTELSTLALNYGTDKATKAIDTFRTQIPFLAQGIHAWWQWVTQALATQTHVLEIQDWVLCYLLPWFYWQQQADKTRHPELKQRYLQAESHAHRMILDHPITQQMHETDLQRWFVWAQWICSKYQRTSSAIEGRNGCLSRLHHTGRGFSPQTLQVLTIIHNFDTRRTDGTTPAQRLFHQTFPYLFEWVVDDLGDLPLPRKSSKSHYS